VLLGFNPEEPPMKLNELAALAANGYWSEDEGRVALAAWRASGQALAAFAARHGLSATKLARWRKRLDAGPTRDRTGRPTPRPVITFAPVEVAERPAEDITIRVGHVEIVVPNATAAWVAALVTELARST
jgi:hypothetical protein